MPDQAAFDLALVGLVAQAEKIKQVRVFERFLRQRRLRRRQTRLEVRHRRALAGVQPVLDLHRQRAARPAVQHRLLGIPGTAGRIVELGQQRHDVEPRQLVSRLLTKSAVRAMQGEEPHVLEVARRPAAHVREGGLQVARQAVDHLRAPAQGLLALQDVVPDATVELHQLGIDSQCRALPRMGDLTLEPGQPFGIALRPGERGFGGVHAVTFASSIPACGRRSCPEIRRGSRVSRRVARV